MQRKKYFFEYHNYGLPDTSLKTFNDRFAVASGSADHFWVGIGRRQNLW